MNGLRITRLCVALLALPALALAQQGGRPDPADPKASVPPVVYASPLKQYQPIGDEQVSPWKSANEEVEKAGGWKAYAKEAQGSDVPSKAATSPTQTTPQSKPAAHEGHADPKKN